MVRSKKIRQSAKGEDCTVNVVGICNYNPETTVLAHIQLKGHGGMSTKPSDMMACYACSECHDFLDNRNHTKSIEQEFKTDYQLSALAKTHERLIDKGLIIVK